MGDLLSGYTLDQVSYFYESGVKNFRRGILEQMLAVRIAYHADQKDWKGAVRDMQDTPKKKKVSAMPLPKEQLGAVRRLLGGK